MSGRDVAAVASQPFQDRPTDGRADRVVSINPTVARANSGPPKPQVHDLVQKRARADKAKARAQHQRIEKLETLLAVEGDLRHCESVVELEYRIANDLMRVFPAQKVFVVRRRKTFRMKMRMAAITSLSSFDRNAPAVVKLETYFERLAITAAKRGEEDRLQPLAFSTRNGDVTNPEQRGLIADLPDLSGALLPFYDRRGHLHAAAIVLAPTDLVAENRPLLARLGTAVGHAWLSLLPKPLRFVPGRRAGLVLGAMGVLAVFAMFIPVPMTALAPVSIVPKSPHVIAAPIDGVVDEILVDANSVVRAGQPLFRYVDTTLRSGLTLAEQRMEVATAKLKTARQNAFGDGLGRKDMAILEAELDLARSELDFAKLQYSKVIVRASRDGVAVFDKKSDWQGKPVSVGERVIEIADTGSVEAKIDLPVSDSIVLNQGASVRLFLDANPLAPIEGRVTAAGYRALAGEGGAVSFDVRAGLSNELTRLPRIGARGTAQIYGETVSLGFYLFRRPISAARQWLGI
ncbi:MAG: HlyD family efflux transporter periplasmic adaptor subunit [Pseudomonadota bacterium]